MSQSDTNKPEQLEIIVNDASAPRVFEIQKLIELLSEIAERLPERLKDMRGES